MKYPNLMRGAVLAVSLGMCAAFAQTRPAPTDSGKGVAPSVATDAGPAPAQERESLGAIILADSPVIAQRHAFQRTSFAAGKVGKDARRASVRSERDADLAQARGADLLELHRRGAGALTEK